MAGRAELELGRMTALTRGAPEGEGPRRDRSLGSLASLVLVAALAIAVVFAGLVAYGATLDNRWYKILAVDGGSMEPSIRAGDAIVITRPPARLREGMVVVLQVEDGLVTHRVVEVEPDGAFTTKGDANDHADDWSGVEVQVVGVVRGEIPFLGRALRSLRAGAWLGDGNETPITATGG
jgi:signal peptidase I